MLPGVRATLEDRADGTFTLQTLQADLGYLQGQSTFRKPGLWRVKDVEGSLDPVFQEDGAVLRKEYRAVVIADSASDSPQEVARLIRDDLVKTDSTIRMMADRSGFDMHYTPGKGVVGLKSAKKTLGTEADKEIIESATLLANTMYKASTVPGVTWFTDWGGSAILTRGCFITSSR